MEESVRVRRAEAMSRRCERPGCSNAATVGYGFSAVRQLAWLSDLAEGSDPHIVGALCERHAAAMQLPKGWWLDDRRTNEPTLFRSPEHRPPPTERPAEPGEERARRRAPRRSHELVIGEQLALDEGVVPVAEPELAAVPADVTDGRPGDDGTGADTGLEVEADDVGLAGRPDHLRLVVGAADPDDPDDVGDLGDLDDVPAVQVEPWIPSFDADDDLGGILDASTPLLARAFGRTARSTTRRGERG